jgi:protein-S-isoprenylcysteine O-methyltransferase Ste14
MTLKQVSLGATAILVIAVVSLLLRRSLFARGLLPLGLQTTAAVLMLWARVTFGGRSFHAGANPTEGGLVMTGPNRFVRHPIYSAIQLYDRAGVASHVTIISMLTAIVATAAVAVRIGAEEALVVELYPEYADYARHTKRIIPFVF